MPPGVYLHIPFCKSRCSYCDFATDVWRSDDAVERYVNAICLEIKGGNPSSGAPAAAFASGVRVGSEGVENAEPGTRNAELDRKSKIQNPKSRDTLPTGRVSAFIDTIYFGGGTPSLLQPRQVERVLEAVHRKFIVDENAEITMEMNPATVTPETLAGYKSLGVNRASFGVQTFNDRHLKLLARGHDSNDARKTFRMMRESGFENISFDLIAGLPGQALDDWKRNLDEAISMQPEHLSLYLLEIHEGTPLADQIRNKRRPMPDAELAAEMYELMLDELAAAAYLQYEISNFAKAGFESRHNTKYWRMDPVFGFGVSAHSFDGVRRYANHRDTKEYIQLIERCCSGISEIDDPDAAKRSGEFVFLNLRLNKGMDLSEFRDIFHLDLLNKYSAEIDRLRNGGLVELENGCIKLTRKGMLYSNEVFAVFV